MDDERDQREGHHFPKAEEEKQDEQAEQDTEGQKMRGNRRPEDSDEGEESGEEKGRYLSDARLKRDVKTIEDAGARLLTLGR